MCLGNDRTNRQLLIDRNVSRDWRGDLGVLAPAVKVLPTERLHFHFSLSCIGEGNGNPLQCSCLENSRTWEPGGLLSLGSHRVGHDWSDLAAAAEYWKLEGEMFSVVDKQLSNYFSLIHLFIKQVLCQLPHLVTNSEVQRKLYHDTNQYFIFFFL